MKKFVLALSIIFLASVAASETTYLVELENGSQLEELEDIDAPGLEIQNEYDIVDYAVVTGPPQSIELLDAQGLVRDIKEDVPTQLPVREGSGDESNRGQEDAGEGGDALIAVLDTGIDTDHVDLESQVVDEQDFTGSGGPEDRQGHGTHVASIAAGTGEGNSEYAGVAPEADLMNVKVLDDDGAGRMSDAIEGIDYAVDNGADIIVLSLGAQTECDGSDPLSQAADNAVQKGVSVITSAGNEGPDEETITAPGCGKDVLTLGASQNQENVADFSSRGLTDDERVKPDVVGQGVNIMAAEHGTTDGYTSKSGTSMSAPYAAGGIALMMEQEPGQDPQTYFEAYKDTVFSLDEPETAEGLGNINITAAVDTFAEEESSGDSDADRGSEDEEQRSEDQEDRDRDEDQQQEESQDSDREQDEAERDLDESDGGNGGADDRYEEESEDQESSEQDSGPDYEGDDQQIDESPRNETSPVTQERSLEGLRQRIFDLLGSLRN